MKIKHRNKFDKINLNYSGDQIKNEMGGACITFGDRRAECRFWWGNLKEGNHLEDTG
jgi:hypothetical protein